MRHQLITAALLAGLVCLPACLESSDDGSGVGPPVGLEMTAQELAFAQQLFDGINQQRVNAGLSPLILDDTATQVAFDHSADMQTRFFFDHVNPDGLTPFDRMAAAGMSYSWAGENIAKGMGTPGIIVAGWMASTGHRNNILNPNYTHTGMGVRLRPGDGWYTQVFFSP
ncbi:MAG: CAP domain-containing protein [Planctomycetota bacterium]|jgi:uncharacterized protein YkwD